MINTYIKSLINYGAERGLIPEADKIYPTNLILDALDMDEYVEPVGELPAMELEEILAGILDYAVEKGIIGDGITEKDLFDTKIMGLLTPRPSEVIRNFEALYEESPEKATDYFY